MINVSRKNKVPICVLIGGGSKLPSIIKAANSRKSNFYISLVVSHKTFSPGIDFATSAKIPAIYFKLPDYRKRIFKGNKKARADFNEKLGWFISQREYAPKLLVFAGWDLVMDKNFFKFFKSKIGNGYSAINLHPALMKKKGESKYIELPDGTKTPVIKGEQTEVLETIIANKYSYFGPSVHFMVADNYDTGHVISREFIKVPNNPTITKLRKYLMPSEDRILIESINKVVTML